MSKKGTPKPRVAFMGLFKNALFELFHPKAKCPVVRYSQLKLIDLKQLKLIDVKQLKLLDVSQLKLIHVPSLMFFFQYIGALTVLVVLVGAIAILVVFVSHPDAINYFRSSASGDNPSILNDVQGGVITINSPTAESSPRQKVSFEKRVAFGNRDPKYCRDNWNDPQKISDPMSIPNLLAPGNSTATFCYKVENNSDKTLRVASFLDDFIDVDNLSDDKRGVQGCVTPGDDANRPFSVPFSPGEVRYCKVGLVSDVSGVVVDSSDASISLEDDSGNVVEISDAASINTGNVQGVASNKYADNIACSFVIKDKLYASGAQLPSDEFRKLLVCARYSSNDAYRSVWSVGGNIVEDRRLLPECVLLDGVGPGEKLEVNVFGNDSNYLGSCGLNFK